MAEHIDHNAHYIARFRDAVAQYDCEVDERGMIVRWPEDTAQRSEVARLSLGCEFVANFDSAVSHAQHMMNQNAYAAFSDEQKKVVSQLLRSTAENVLLSTMLTFDQPSCADRVNLQLLFGEFDEVPKYNAIDTIVLGQMPNEFHDEWFSWFQLFSRHEISNS